MFYEQFFLFYIGKFWKADLKIPHCYVALFSSNVKTNPAKPIAKLVQAKPVALKQSPQTFEAEEAGRKGPSVAKNNGGYTGKGFIDFQEPSGEHLKWLIQSNSEGECTLSFRYALAGSNRPLQLKVNGKIITKAMPFMGTGSWTTWKSISAEAPLKAGVNDIRLESTGASGPNIDSLIIVRK